MPDDKKNILLIEDNEDHAELILRSFETMSYFEIIHASTLNEASISMTKNNFDLIISDMRVPDGDGIDFIRENKLSEQFPVIVMTSFGDEKRAVEAMKIGVRDYIVKSPEALMDMSKNADLVLREWRLINEKREAQKATIESEKKFTLFMNHLPAGICIKDEHGKVLFTNDYIKTNFSDSQWEGNIIDTIEETPAVKALLKESDELLEKDYSEEIHNVHDIKGEDRVLFAQKFIFGNSGQPKLTGTISHDITEQKKAEAQLIKAKEKVEESDRLKTAFLANISHEVRTPMNAISGFSQLLQFDDIEEETRNEYAQMIRDNTDRLLSVINDIIDISKIESGEINTAPITFNINILLQNLLTRVEAKRDKDKDKKNSIKMLLNTPFPDEQAEIQTDHSKMERIFENLLDNALKFTMEGEIEFGYKIQKSERGKTLYFYVSDTGIGMSEDQRSFVFDKFRQADESNTRKYGGTGLGLTLSKSLINLLGGTIAIDTKPGVGTVFNFKIPFTTTPQEETEVLKKKDEYKWLGKTILIIEAEYSSFFYLSKILEKSECAILRAKNGREAINISIDNQNINAILMDTTLPDIDGFALLKIIRDMKPDIPVIAQTANAILDDKEKCLSSGFNNYIAKPIFAGELYEVLDIYL